MARYIFVCTGNTCRSPMAEALLRARIEADRLPDIEVLSRGLSVFPGSTLSPHAREVLNEQALPLPDFEPEPISDRDITPDTTLLAMAGSHVRHLRSMFPNTPSFTLKEYIGSYGDVSDPFGGTIDTYRRCFAELRDLIQRMELQ